MLTKICFAVLVAATVASASVPAVRNNGTDGTATPKVALIDQGWCSGPRQHTDFRCLKN
jgi:hypothetical protein